MQPAVPSSLLPAGELKEAIRWTLAESLDYRIDEISASAKVKRQRFSSFLHRDKSILAIPALAND
jgi:hypothetical protein